MRRSNHRWVTALGIAMLAACAGTGPPEPEPTPEPESELLGSVCGETAENTAIIKDGDALLVWHPEPSPIPLNEQFDLRVQVTDTLGEGLASVTLDVDAQMPQHGHGMNTLPYVEADPENIGWFVVDGMQLHMPGEWKLHFDVTDGDDGPTERTTFDVTCIE